MTSFDTHSAATMLRYLAKATQRLREREHSRKKLKAEIQRLKNISTESLKGFIEDLEQSIENAIKAESKILKTQKSSEETHQKIQKQINKIDDKVRALMKMHSLQKQKLGFLETEQEKKEKLKLELKQKTAKLEKQLSKAGKKHTKAELSKIQDKIKKLKQKLA